jgi:hypothetical protein
VADGLGQGTKPGVAGAEQASPLRPAARPADLGQPDGRSTSGGQVGAFLLADLVPQKQAAATAALHDEFTYHREVSRCIQIESASLCVELGRWPDVFEV